MKFSDESSIMMNNNFSKNNANLRSEIRSSVAATEEASTLMGEIWQGFAQIRDIERLARDEGASRDESPMKGYDLVHIRNMLGLGVDFMAKFFHADYEQLEFWEKSNAIIPVSLSRRVIELRDITSILVDIWTKKYVLAPVGQRTVRVYFSDKDYHAAHPDSAPMPALWHRKLFERVAQRVPVTIVS